MSVPQLQQQQHQQRTAAARRLIDTQQPAYVSALLSDKLVMTCDVDAGTIYMTVLVTVNRYVAVCADSPGGSTGTWRCVVRTRRPTRAPSRSRRACTSASWRRSPSSSTSPGSSSTRSDHPARGRRRPTRGRIHRNCLKIYPKTCLKTILRQKLRCLKMILRYILSRFTKVVLGDLNSVANYDALPLQLSLSMCLHSDSNKKE